MQSNPANLKTQLLILSVCLQPQHAPVEDDTADHQIAWGDCAPEAAKSTFSVAAKYGDQKQEEDHALWGPRQVSDFHTFVFLFYLQ